MDREAKVKLSVYPSPVKLPDTRLMPRDIAFNWYGYSYEAVVNWSSVPAHSHTCPVFSSGLVTR